MPAASSAGTLTPATWALLVPVVLAAAAGVYLWQSSTPARAPSASLVVAEEATAAPERPTAVVQARPGDAAAPAPAPAAAIVSVPAAPALPSPAAPSASIEDVVARALGAVVMVETPDSRGTGFFVTADTLVTNDHVSRGAASVTVRLHDGTTRTARVERAVAEVDLAILRVSGQPPPHVLTLARADDVRPGQEVIAIGSALGLQSTVTRGIVSARRMAGAVLLLQTDAAINPGNSGGPLLNRDGAVVGVTTLKMGSGAEGLGFAVAVDHLRALLDGRPVTAATSASTQAPLAAGVPAFGTEAGADGQRTRGQEAYQRDVQQLARQVAQMDANWTRFATTCAPQAGRDGDRPWFVLAERDVPYSGRDLDCPSWLTDLRRMSGEFAAAMRQAGDAARRAGVYPGTLRDLRRQQRLDWTGFER